MLLTDLGCLMQFETISHPCWLSFWAGVRVQMGWFLGYVVGDEVSTVIAVVLKSLLGSLDCTSRDFT